MAFSLVGSGSDGANAASLTGLSWPTVQAGDFALLWWTMQSTSTPTTPTGFTQQSLQVGDSGSMQVGFYTKVCTGSESGTITLTGSAANRQSAVFTVIRGGHATTPLDTWAVRDEASAVTSHACPGVTTGYANVAIVTAISERASSGTTGWTAPSGYTERADSDGLATGTGGTITAVADDGLAVSRSAGASVTPPNWSSTSAFASANVLVWTVSIRPAAAATGALARVTGTGTARPLTASRTYALGRVTATGTARALTGALARDLGRVSSTGTALPMTAAMLYDGPRRPDLRLEVAFSSGASTGTLLTLDDPTRGRLDTGTLGGSVAGDEEPVWTDIGADGRLLSCTVERGSRRVDAPVVTYEPGTLTATLSNVDRRFDPTWLDGPYTAETTTLDGTSTALNTNGGFEAGLTGWGSGFGGTLTQSSTRAHTGTYSGRFVPTGAATNPFVDAAWETLEAGQTYRATAWVWCTADTNVAASIHWYSSTPTFLGQATASKYVMAGTWTEITVTGVAPSGCTQGPMLVTMVGKPAASNIMYVDDAEFAHLPYRRATQVTAMRAVRLLATWNDVAYEVWRGFADQWDVTWTPGSSDSTCILTATDASKIFAGIDRTAVTPVGGGETTGERIDRILDGVDWPTTDRDIAAGNSLVQETALEGDAWAEMQAVTATELGELYIDGGGRVVFRGRREFLTGGRSTVSQATFGDGPDELPAEDVAVSADDATFFNDIRVTRAGGTEQTAEDATSIDLYYRKTYRPGTDLLLETDSEALAWAQWLLHIAADPELRFTDLVIEPAAGPVTLWPEALGREIGDRITIVRRPPGGGDAIERDVLIRGVRHEITDETWVTTFTLQDASRYGSFFILDHPTLGALDANALAY